MDGDVVRGFIRTGRARPEEHWDEEASRQWWLGARQSASLARAYVDAGVGCVLDIYAPPVEDDPWHDLLAGLAVLRVDLMPSLEACRARNAAREGLRLSDEALARNHGNYAWSIEQFPQSHVLDTSTWTLEETVAAVQRLEQQTRTSS